jgi:hypothetical protein
MTPATVGQFALFIDSLVTCTPRVMSPIPTTTNVITMAIASNQVQPTPMFFRIDVGGVIGSSGISIIVVELIL